MAPERVSKVSRPNGYGIAHTGSELYGHVVTRWGFVVVSSGDGLTSLRIVHDGYLVSRLVRRAYTQRGLASVASRFAEEIFG